MRILKSVSLKPSSLHSCLRIAKMAVNIGGMRHPYKSPKEAFLETDLACKEPFGQFKTWFDEACATPAILEPNAMCLATATREGIPSCRMVLLKSFSSEGFVFYTNYLSRKGRELTCNPHASLCFFWEPLMRSVRVEGRVRTTSAHTADEYFGSRPRPSQIGAAVSRQSETIASRDVLLARKEELTSQYGDPSVVMARPECWGGYVVEPHTVEFWQGQSDRIHDRIVFTRPFPTLSEGAISANVAKDVIAISANVASDAIESTKGVRRGCEGTEDGDTSEGLVTKGDDGWSFRRLSP